MRGERLELDGWEQLRGTEGAIDLGKLLDEVESLSAQLPEAERLRFVGEALLEVAELWAGRAERALDRWEDGRRDPRVGDGFFAAVVRQSMAIDLTDLMEPTPSRKQRAKSGGKPEGSSVVPMEKRAVLAMVEQLEVEKEAQRQAVLSVAHSEDVAGWTAVIERWLLAAPDRPVSIAELGCSLNMAWVEVWLGVLLGDFQLEQWGEFYESPIWVKRLEEPKAC